MKRELLYSLVGCLIVLLCAACTDAQKAKDAASGKKHRLTLYSGGREVREWVSTGEVQNEDHSDGYYFMDAETHKLVRISGTVAVEIAE